MDTHYLTTGDAARLLGRTEPQLADLVRRGKVHPSPDIVAGRRLWTREHLLQAADALGVLSESLRHRIDSAALSPVEDAGQRRAEEVARGA